ncbi:hypothetical protein A0J48_013515 [Sphaerospermopsis aphanizomenoides BCCUSP55]|uniref:hypothetical protein n=1 Tax=Sphaerospermopsis aphanizomenoides TaxID=459663 RepID=UPI0019088B73|nr:hypothetical protein [Sphaerospermopsis aphanizomenoides]MBK1988544.1 hypothetical protein [Sphaerospermopsis aphanizomenoides BCCUSP55]
MTDKIEDGLIRFDGGHNSTQTKIFLELAIGRLPVFMITLARFQTLFIKVIKNTHDHERSDLLT